MAVVLLFFLALIAFALSALVGGGAGLLLIPALGSVISVAQVPAALSLGTMSSSASRIGVFFRHIRWDVVRNFVPAALPAVFGGAWLLQYVNPVYLEIAMALFLLGNLPMLFKKKTTDEAVPRGSHRSLWIIGFLAGFLSGLTGAVGLLFNRFYLRFGLSKEQIIATRAANEIVLHLFKLCLYAAFGLFTGAVWKLGIAVGLAGIISSYVMRWGIKKISERLFQRIGYSAMVLSGVLMLTQSVSGLFSQNNGSMRFEPIARGVESKVQWQGASMAIEFQWDEGFEYEQVIPFTELPVSLQDAVKNRRGGADEVRVEEVFGWHSHSYEAYYFKKGVLVEKADFEG